MMEYEREIERALACLSVNTGYELPIDEMVLDARFAPTKFQLDELERHEESLRKEAAQLEAALDEQLENLEEANSGSETVHDYFTYSPNYLNFDMAPQKHYSKVQTMPSKEGKIGLEQLRLDRCSSNDSGLGNSLSPNSRFIETSNLNQSQPEADSSTGSEDISPEDQSQPVRKRFPRLGLSSLSQNLPENNSNQPVEHSSGSSESSESDDPSEPRPRTSTPQQSPLKPCAEETPMLPDFMNPCVSQGQPLPSIEDLLYPGINNKPPQNTVLNSSKKMLKNVKSKTSAGLSKMKMSISELVKTERAEAELQRECFEKITKFAADSAEDDFSIHMIEEASLQRLTAVKPVLTESLNNRRGVQFPPVGSNEVNSKQMSPLVVPKVNQARRVRKSRQTALALQTAKRSDSKTSKRRRMISEVRKRVQEAHQEPGKAADVRVPKCYRDKKPVYLKQGQIPQYRNGQLDWNYLWFFSDSSTTTNSTSRDQTLNTSSPTNETSESDSEKPVTPKNRKSSRGTSGYTTPNQKTPPKPETPTSIMREAKKKRIRRLVVSPPKDDNVKLLGMM